MYIYSFYHCNLMFSSIEESKRKEVIDNCYWPLLTLAQKGNKLSIEASALTLEIIRDIDPLWISELKMLIKDNKIEFIGSGYSQIIAPLVPYEVNIQNLKIGEQVYLEMLGVKPEVYLINEMAFSRDLIAVYNECGISNVIIEWNNFYKYSKNAGIDYSYKPIRLYELENDNLYLNIIWADSIAFQKFQRYVHDDLAITEYLDYLETCNKKNNKRFFPLYSSDAEIFNFRPGRYKTENSLNINEWERIEELQQLLKKSYEFVFIKEILQDCISELEKVDFFPLIPIQVKKQDKYNVYRWAIGGRDNLNVNAKCYQLLDYYKANDVNESSKLKELLYLWSSDFRTHITENRFLKFQETLNIALNKIDVSENIKKNSSSKKISYVRSDDFIHIETDVFSLILNRKKGLTIHSFVRKNKDHKSTIGFIPHGTYDDISFSSDYFSGYFICYDNDRRQFTHLLFQDETVIEAEDCIIINTGVSTEGKFKLIDTFTIYFDHIEINRIIEIIDFNISIIHPFIFTFLPDDKLDDYKYKVTCGGKKDQTYPIFQNQPHLRQTNFLTISAVTGFSPTSEFLEICNERSEQLIKFEISNSKSPLVLRFHSEPGIGIGEKKMPYCSLIFSAQEINDAYKGNGARNNIIESSLKIY